MYKAKQGKKMINKTLTQNQIDSFLRGDTKAVLNLAEIFMNINGYEKVKNTDIVKFLNGWEPEYLTTSESGWGMSTMDAIRCLYDLKRTAIFAKGIKKATDEIARHYPNEKLVAIDAGCGTGITSAALALSGFDKVIGIDINHETITQAKKFIKGLGLSNKVLIKFADATTYDPKRKIHLIHSENLYTGIILEPQVQIINHLKKYLKKDGLIIPEIVTLHMTPLTVNWESVVNVESSIRLKHVRKENILYKSSKTIHKTIRFTPNTPQKDLITATLTIDNPKSNAILVEMDVTVYGGIVLPANNGKFLGTSEVFKVKCDCISGDKGVISYRAGGKPPKELIDPK